MADSVKNVRIKYTVDKKGLVVINDILKEQQKTLGLSDAQVEQLNKSFKKASKSAEQLGKTAKENSKKMSGLDKSIKDIGKTLAAAFTVRAIVNFIGASMKAFDMQEKANTKLLTALKGREDIQKRLIAQGEKLQKSRLFADDVTIDAMARMATIIGVNEKAIARLTPLVQDFATAKGMDLASASELVAKSIGSSTNSLMRYGIEIEGAAGSSERLEMAIAALNKQVGGQSEAAARVGMGSIQLLKIQWEDFTEKIGSAFIGMLDKVLDKQHAISNSYEEDKDNLMQRQVSMNALISAIENYTGTEEGRLRLIDKLNSEYGDLIGNEISLKGTTAELEAARKNANAQLIQEIALMAQKEKFAKTFERIMELETDRLEKQTQIDNARIDSQKKGIRAPIKGGTGFVSPGMTLLVLEQDLININKRIADGYKEIADGGELAQQVIDTFNKAYSATTQINEEVVGDNVMESWADFAERVGIVSLEFNSLTNKFQPFSKAWDIVDDETEKNTESFKEFAESINLVALEFNDLTNKFQPFSNAWAIPAESIKEANLQLEKFVTLEPKFSKKGKFAGFGEVATAEDRPETFRDINKEDQLFFGLGVAGDVASMNDDIVSIYEESLNRRENLLNASMNKELEMAGSNANAKKKIEEKYERERAKIIRKRIIAEKEVGIFQAFISTASAVINQLNIKPASPLNFVLAALAGTIGAAQVAQIASTPVPKFAKGTLNVKGGRRGEDSVHALLMPGEAVIPSSTNSQYADAIDAIYNRKISPEAINNFAKNGGSVMIDNSELVKAFKDRPEKGISISEHGIAGWYQTKGKKIKIMSSKYAI